MKASWISTNKGGIVRKTELKEYYVAIAIVIAGVYGVILSFVERNPGMESEAFILGGVVIAGVMNMLAGKLQIQANEKREEKIHRRRQKRLKDDRIRENKKRIFSRIKKVINYFVEDITMLALYVIALDIETSDDKDIEYEKFQQKTNDMNAERKRRLEVVGNLKPPKQITELHSVYSKWKSIVELHEEIQAVVLTLNERYAILLEAGEAVTAIILQRGELEGATGRAAEAIKIRQDVEYILDEEIER